MLNINYGEKIIEGCITTKCPIYNIMICLSNSSGLKGVVKCPKIFCERINKKIFKCHKCEQDNNIFNGYFDENNNFHCYKCKEEKKQKVEIERKTLSKNFKLEKIKELIFNLSNNNKFFENYLDTKNGSYEFYNPLNSSPAPLVWTEDYLNETGFELLKNEILSFFKTYLERFKEESCDGCVLQNTFYQHLSCLDCSRNKKSPSIIKVDRFKGGDNYVE